MHLYKINRIFLFCIGVEILNEKLLSFEFITGNKVEKRGGHLKTLERYLGCDWSIVMVIYDVTQ